jgi:predicted TPR repeat methyltransferase
VTIPEALRLAAGLHQDGLLQDAETLYRRILHVVPDQPEAMNFLGVLTFHKGNPAEALTWIDRAIEVQPDYADAHNNRGNLLRHQGDLAGACEAYRRAVTLDPDNVGSRYNWACALAAHGEYAAAVVQYRRAIGLNPQHTEAYRRAGRILCQLGRVPEAADLYLRWLKHEPDHPIARHMLAACCGGETPTRASDEYVQRVFDGFSESFDKVLEGLDYRAPQLIAAALAGLYPVATSAEIAAADERPSGTAGVPLDLLDAGCGTGLCGPLIRRYARQLVGVDLSRGMLDKARARGVYDTLVQAELTTYLQSQHAAFDSVVSADTLCYFGDLTPVFRAVAGALRPGGSFVFTTEQADRMPEKAAEKRGQTPSILCLHDDAATRPRGSDPFFQQPPEAAGYRLNVHGRYSHTAEYVRSRLSEAGFTVVAVEKQMLRTENSQPVNGLLVIARAPTPPPASAGRTMFQ